MPLIDVTLRPGYEFPEAEVAGISSEGPIMARIFIRKVFGPELPALFVSNHAEFGMDENTPEEGVQVQFHDYEEDDINIADVWIKVQFSEEPPGESMKFTIRDAVYDAVANLFVAHGLAVPNNFILDIFWGPTNGRGTVNGTAINW
jgi:hypothetical protein